MLEQQFPGAVPAAAGLGQALATGLAELDGILPGQGLPRGKVSVWAPGVGASALLRSACQQAVRRGERAAWIDAGHTAPGSVAWEGVALVRPPTAVAALVAAEELLRSGGFALVVLTGASSGGAQRVRMTRAAGEGGGALVELSEHRQMAAMRLRSWVPAGGWRWVQDALGEAVALEAVRVRVQAEALGWSRGAEVTLPVEGHGVRLAPDPSLPSRRGAGR